MPDRTPVRSSVKVLGGIFFVLLSLVALEVISFAAVGPLAARGLLYRPQSLDGFDEYILRRDPALGWPAPDAFGGKEHDDTGARWSPAFAGEEACVSVYGDSFTFGSGVAHEEAWPNRLAERLGCRVTNFGVRGYGSDQALLRFELNETDGAPVVVLGHLTENILRNVNQLRGLLYAGSQWGLKPRWIIGADGRLDLVPIPTGSLSELSRVIEAPEDHLAHDFFVPGGDSGKQRASFPYSLSVLRSLSHFHIRSKIRGVPWFTEFYDPAHPAGGVEVTARILERFSDRAGERGQRALAVVIPTGLDLVHYRESGEWVYGPLVARAEALGVEVLDLGPALMEPLGDEDPCSLFLVCNGHFGPSGNQRIAELVEVALVERGLVTRLD